MKYTLADLFEKPISGEWGVDLDEGEKGVKVIRTTNFTNLGKLNLSNVVVRNIDIKKYQDKGLRYGDIIIEKSGGSPAQPVGRVVVFEENTDERYFCNNFTSILRPTELINYKYSLYLLKDLYNKRVVLRYQNKTTGIINIRLNEYIQGTEVEIPNKGVQQKIAQALDKSQSLIDKRKAQLKWLDELVKSRFIEMFGNPVTNSKGWEIKDLGTLGYFKNGMNYKQSDSGFNIKFLGVGEFKYGNIINSSNMLPTLELQEEPNEEYLLKKGDIVFVRSNGSKELVGRSVLVRELEEKTTYSGFCIRYRNQCSEVMPDFLIQLFLDGNFKKTFNQDSRGVNINNLNQQMLSVLKIIVPPKQLQNQFSDFVKQVDKLKFEMESSLKELENNFNSLMQKAFKGELF
jgi:type I restriction enzyme S subunit